MSSIRQKCAEAAEHIRREVTWLLQNDDIEPRKKELEADLSWVESHEMINQAEQGCVHCMKQLARVCKKWGVI